MLVRHDGYKVLVESTNAFLHDLEKYVHSEMIKNTSELLFMGGLTQYTLIEAISKLSSYI